jgi:primosomal protein DnaI
MQSIDDALKKMFPNSMQANIQEIQNQLLQNPEIRDFLLQQEEQGLTSDMVRRSLTKLYQFQQESSNCKTCEGLSHCKNMINGYRPKLIRNGPSIDLQYERCQYKIRHDDVSEKSKLVQSFFIPKEILGASFETLEDTTNETRFDAIREAADFVKHFNPGEKIKGLYLYGTFGVGKTFLMGAIANALAKKNISSALVYAPDFFREMKNSIGEQNIDKKMDVIKKVPVLVFDDIGAETMSAWIRDEILGSILQYRMMENLPTLFTSNYDYEGLEEHLAYSHKTGTELMKAKRIMERIKHNTMPVYMDGDNRRI